MGVVCKHMHARGLLAGWLQMLQSQRPYLVVPSVPRERVERREVAVVKKAARVWKADESIFGSRKKEAEAKDLLDNDLVRPRTRGSLARRHQLVAAHFAGKGEGAARISRNAGMHLPPALHLAQRMQPPRRCMQYTKQHKPGIPFK